MGKSGRGRSGIFVGGNSQVVVQIKAFGKEPRDAALPFWYVTIDDKFPVDAHII